jgi:hypothetical protein
MIRASDIDNDTYYCSKADINSLLVVLYYLAEGFYHFHGSAKQNFEQNKN